MGKIEFLKTNKEQLESLVFNEDVKKEYCIHCMKQLKIVIPDGFNLKFEEIDENSPSYSKSYKKIYGSFIPVANIERRYNKDIFNFNKDEILDVFNELHYNKNLDLRVCWNFMRGYCKWAKDNKKIDKSIFDELNYNVDVILAFNEDKFKALYIKESDMWDIVNKSAPQDSLCLAAAFHYIWGTKFSELINLKKDDLNGNELKVIDDITGERTVVINDNLKDLIIKACNEKAYESKGVKSFLVGSEYVIRPIVNEVEKIKGTSLMLNARVQKVLEQNGYENIKTSDVLVAGALHRLNELKLEVGILEDNHFINEFNKTKTYIRSWDELKRIYNIVY